MPRIQRRRGHIAARRASLKRENAYYCNRCRRSHRKGTQIAEDHRDLLVNLKETVLI